MTALVIGAGPAGLMAAEQIARAGHEVILADAMPTPARKFLMAGKSGLNLTKDEPTEAFSSHFDAWLRPYIAAFGAEEMQDFARDLGIEIFTGSSGRVFPTGMKASPFLRAWLARLDGLRVIRHARWRWTGWAENGGFVFDTPDGPQSLWPDACVLAMGGASWPKLGSTGSWTSLLGERGVALAPFQPANMGFHLDWSPHMRPHFGAPLKSIALKTPSRALRAECVVSARGIEGGGIYELAAELRGGQPLALDLAPDMALEALTAKLQKPRGKTSLSNHLRKTAKLDPLKLALLNEWARPLPDAPETLAALIKALPVPLGAPFPLEEAISTAGGIMAAALTADLELRALPRCYAAGEMLDWEAPTGGYLLTACFATGLAAGQAASRALAR